MIKTKITDGLGIITLARPKVHNAINRVIMEQLEQTLNEWCHDQRVKMLVITGEGQQTFCSGGDLQEFHQLQEHQVEQLMHQMKKILYQLQTFPKPTVAALNGTAVGGGCEIATACDFRVAHRNVMLGFIQIQLGISTGWGGGMRLFHLVPRGKAMELLLSGAKITAQEALEFGLIEKILPQEGFLEHVYIWMHSFSKHSLGSLMAYKATALDMEQQLGLPERLDREVDRFLKLWGSAEHRQAVEQFLSKSRAGQTKFKNQSK